MPDAVTAATPAAPAITPPAGEPPEKAPAAAAASAAVPPEPKADPMAPRFAALARDAQKLAREKQAWAAERTAKEQELKAQADALAARAAKADEYEKTEKAAKLDPGGHLRRLYGDNWYDVVTEYKLRGEAAAPAELQVQAVREQALSEVEKLRKENQERWDKLEADRKAAQEAEREKALADQKSVIEQWESDTVAFVNANAERYELIKEYEAQELVTRVIRDTFAKSKRVLTAAEAADAVEQHLEERSAKVYSGKKWQSRLAAAKPTEERASEPAKTLTNAAATGATVPSTSGAKKDRIQLAVEAMEAAEREMAAKAAAK